MRKIDVLFAGFISAALIGFWVFISPLGTARVSEAAPTTLTDPTQQAAGQALSDGNSSSTRDRLGEGGDDDSKLTVRERARQDALKRVRLERERRNAQYRESQLSEPELARLRERRRDTPPTYMNQQEFTPPPADAPRLPPVDGSSRNTSRPVYY